MFEMDGWRELWMNGLDGWMDCGELLIVEGEERQLLPSFLPVMTLMWLIVSRLWEEKEQIAPCRHISSVCATPTPTPTPSMIGMRMWAVGHQQNRKTEKTAECRSSQPWTDARRRSSSDCVKKAKTTRWKKENAVNARENVMLLLLLLCAMPPQSVCSTARQRRNGQTNISHNKPSVEQNWLVGKPARRQQTKQQQQ